MRPGRRVGERSPAEAANTSGAPGRHPFEWWRDAACRPGSGIDPELFHGPFRESTQARNTRVAAALQVCAGCPVRGRCLAEVLSFEGFYRSGIWGGTTEDDRRAAAKAARCAAA